jgi:MFS family permease
VVDRIKRHGNLSIIALIAVVNALGYGIILPVIYAYAGRYGLTDFETGLLIAIFSVCQFIATPIVGRLSDKYGRRPMLLWTIGSAAVSFFMTAFAPSAFFIFFARALDGFASANIPVAGAVISDTLEKGRRAKGFGIMGAAFAFGLVFGPAIAAATVSVSPNLPFVIAGCISLISSYVCLG